MKQYFSTALAGCLNYLIRRQLTIIDTISIMFKTLTKYNTD